MSEERLTVQELAEMARVLRDPLTASRELLKLRSDLMALVPLARVGVRLWIERGYTVNLKMLDAAQRVLAAYDREG